jgi:hypothetical protein
MTRRPGGGDSIASRRARITLEKSAHVPHLGEPERYLHVLTGFMDRVEAQG